MKKSVNINEFYKTISNKKDFEEFLRLLNEDFKENKQGWDNDNLELFLDGLYGYNYDTTEEESKEQPTWKMFAEMLLANAVVGVRTHIVFVASNAFVGVTHTRCLCWVF